MTILLVDDAEDCIATLEIALQILPGVTLRVAQSAEEALALLERETISAMITDLQLPGMNGFELIGRVRGEPRFRTIPILAVSAVADPSAPQAALDSGANAFFRKPFSPGAVRRKLEELIHAM